MTLSDRFWAKVNKNGSIPTYRPDLDACWLWLGCTSSKGYGEIRGNAGSKMYAHRVSLILIGQVIPATLEVDHLCRVRHCVNPLHLELVTRRTNQLRGFTLTSRNVAKTHCPQGHPYVEGNIKRRANREGRECRQCDLDRKHRMAGLPTTPEHRARAAVRMRAYRSRKQQSKPVHAISQGFEDEHERAVREGWES